MCIVCSSIVEYYKPMALMFLIPANMTWTPPGEFRSVKTIISIRLNDRIHRSTRWLTVLGVRWKAKIIWRIDYFLSVHKGMAMELTLDQWTTSTVPAQEPCMNPVGSSSVLKTVWITPDPQLPAKVCTFVSSFNNPVASQWAPLFRVDRQC